MPSGYSGKSLVEKLGLREGMRALVLHAPTGYDKTLSPPEGIQWVKRLSKDLDWLQIFAVALADLEKDFNRAAPLMAEGGMIWVSWPKKSAKIPTDIDENAVRRVCLPTGWVDVKVCAVDETWSGLKFLRRRK